MSYFSESSAIHIGKHLLEERAHLCIYDPKVPETVVRNELALVSSKETVQQLVDVFQSPYEAVKNAHSVVILTEWDEFKEYDYEKMFAEMKKPASIFDGRLILDHNKLKKIGFRVFSIGTAPTQSMKSFI